MWSIALQFLWIILVPSKMGDRSRLLWIFGIFLLVAPRVVLADNETFVIKKGETKDALVGGEKLVLNLTLGSPTTYKQGSTFSINVGNADMKIEVLYAVESVGALLKFTSDGKDIVSDLSKLVITPTKFEVGENSLTGNFTFTPHEGSYTISIGVSDDAPEGFYLGSNDAQFAPARTSNDTGAPKPGVLSAGPIAGIIVAIFAVVLLIFGGAGYAYYRFVYKPKRMKAGGGASSKEQQVKKGPSSNKEPDNVENVQAASPAKEPPAKGEIKERPPTENELLFADYLTRIPGATGAK